MFMIPLNFLSIICEYRGRPVSLLSTCREKLTSVLVARLGLGKDIWNVDPDDITGVLYVRYVLTRKLSQEEEQR